MKKLIYTLALLIIIHCTLIIDNCQSQWSEQVSGVTSYLYSVSATDNNVVWICGAGGKVLRTTNGGTNWSLTTSPNAALDLYNICGIDANTALVTGSGTTAYVYKTINGGANWTLVFSQVGGFMNTISRVNFVNNDALLMTGDPVGGRWSLWQSTNAGTNWDSTDMYLPQSGTETGYNNSFDYWPPDYVTTIWFGTNNSRIYKFSNGQGWTTQSTGTQTDILAIFFYDSLGGAAGSTTGGLYTTDGGQNWGNNPTYIGSGSINGIAFTHEGAYYTRGSSVYFSPTGYIFTAATTQTGTYTHLAKPNSISSNNLWAIRNNGGISKYTSSVGITPISTEIPAKYSLSQNYPNPFNPTTTMKFDIPKSGYVKLNIYDINGRILECLVNEEMNPGIYEVNWNATHYPSGVYFYRLTTDFYSETKKMILMK
ncbi:MAG TPA: T9SS type A sorting domain-containing protein [Ignavibacteria bacterium]